MTSLLRERDGITKVLCKGCLSEDPPLGGWCYQCEREVTRIQNISRREVLRQLAHMEMRVRLLKRAIGTTGDWKEKVKA